ncbi:MAG: type II secretion system protein [Phycisphaerae bacterium]|nr:type II secretion system protein [Phycisphaerae bacterium]
MRKKAFTLVELLIVVIILGILAAVVIPQFSDASTEARESSLATNLATIRGQIELYRLQHNGNYPPEANFDTVMTSKTNADHTTTGTPTLGPYLQRIPNNPFTNTNNVVNTGTPASTTAWYYNAATGTFQAFDTVAHSNL